MGTSLLFWDEDKGGVIDCCSYCCSEGVVDLSYVWARGEDITTEFLIGTTLTGVLLKVISSRGGS